VALTLILAAMTLWRRTAAFEPMARGANVLLMLAGFVLAGQQVRATSWAERSHERQRTTHPAVAKGRLIGWTLGAAAVAAVIVLGANTAG
jgi:hypothetical protein